MTNSWKQPGVNVDLGDGHTWVPGSLSEEQVIALREMIFQVGINEVLACAADQLRRILCPTQGEL